MRWYVHRQGKTVGPIPHAQLLEYYANGRLVDSDLVSNDGTNWLTLAEAVQGVQPARAGRTDSPQANPSHQPSQSQSRTVRVPQVVEDEDDQPANATPAEKPANYLPVIIGSSAAVIVAAMLLIMVVIALNANRPPQVDAAAPTTDPAVKAAPQRAAANPVKLAPSNEPKLVIRSLQDEDNIAQAVGLVVCGLQGRRFDGQMAQLPISTGSCFAISPNGHVLTNAHVIAPMIGTVQELHRRGRTDVTGQVWVFFGSEKKFVARILNISQQFDLAVLETMQTNNPYFALWKSDKLSRGLTVTALGFPGASMEPLSQTEMMLEQQRKQMNFAAVEQAFRQRDFVYVQTSGKISRVVTEEGGVNWIQHDTTIHPGNSGGPLLDDQATVVGINTLKHKAAGGISYSFTLPQIRSEIQSFVPGIVWR